ncbi:MAG: N,N-dimethylformamidase beta subunit family domain-containing protein [Gaiellaceae bacterium]
MTERPPTTQPTATLTRRGFARRSLVAIGALGALSAFPGVARALDRPYERTAAPRLRRLRVFGSGPAFRADNAMLATITPARGRQARIVTVEFDLDRRLRVQLEVARAGVRGLETVATKTVRLRAGRRRIAWTAPRQLEPGTYLLRLRATDRHGRTTLYGSSRPATRTRPAPVLRVLGVDTTFARRSYRAGEKAELLVEADTAKLTFRTFHSGSESVATRRNDEMHGTPVSEPVTRDWRRRRSRPHRIRVAIGDWPTGLYYTRVTTADGRRGHAPFIVRPSSPGPHRVAVILPTHTWQAYNFFDRDRDGWGDTWYAGTTERIHLDRPFSNRGVPPRFRVYDLPFLRWLHATGKQADFYAEDDLEQFSSGAALRDAYDLIVFSGHSEYVTQHAFSITEAYRDLGGNLMFLSANSFFWKVRKRASRLDRISLWRDRGKPEAALIGTQYLANDDGAIQDGFEVVGADLAPWAFEGTGLVNGSVFGQYGIEIDHTTAKSPPGTMVLARIPDLFGPGRTAEMTYYETPAGARVFSAGVLAFGIRLLRDDAVAGVLENVWRRLSQP